MFTVNIEDDMVTLRHENNLCQSPMLLLPKGEYPDGEFGSYLTFKEGYHAQQELADLLRPSLTWYYIISVGSHIEVIQSLEQLEDTPNGCVRVTYSLSEVESRISIIRSGLRQRKQYIPDLDKAKAFVAPYLRTHGLTITKGTVYRFYNPEHGEIYCTQRDLINEFSLSQQGVSNVVNGKAKTCGGWSLYENNYTPPKKYTFIHPNVGTFEGTQLEFRQKFYVDCQRASQLVCGRIKSYRGWKLA